MSAIRPWAACDADEPQRHTLLPGDTLVVLAPTDSNAAADDELHEALKRLMPWLAHVVVVCEVDGIRSEWTDSGNVL